LTGGGATAIVGAMPASASLAPAAETIAHTIQLAVAPVFLLAGLGQLLNLLATRLSRVIDRARWIEEHFSMLDRKPAVQELRLLDTRMRVVSISITLCTVSAVAVCLVVAGLFVARLEGAGFARPVAFLFILAMALLVAALALFLVEIHFAFKAIRIRNDLLERE
jgi:MFS family permease